MIWVVSIRSRNEILGSLEELSK